MCQVYCREIVSVARAAIEVLTFPEGEALAKRIAGVAGITRHIPSGP